MATFFERFTILLKENSEMKQWEIAEKTKIDKTSISKYCNGKATPDSKNLIKLATLFNVSPSWLSGDNIPRSRLELVKQDNYIVAYNGENPLKQKIAESIENILNGINDEQKLSQIKMFLDTYKK